MGVLSISQSQLNFWFLVSNEFLLLLVRDWTFSIRRQSTLHGARRAP